MTKSKMIQFALVAIGAGLCISGQSPSRELGETDNYSKVSNQEEREISSAEETAEFDQESGRKSAARRVVEGSSNTTLNGKRKSAAQRALEG